MSVPISAIFPSRITTTACARGATSSGEITVTFLISVPPSTTFASAAGRTPTGANSTIPKSARLLILAVRCAVPPLWIQRTRLFADFVDEDFPTAAHLRDRDFFDRRRPVFK